MSSSISSRRSRPMVGASSSRTSATTTKKANAARTRLRSPTPGLCDAPPYSVSSDGHSLSDFVEGASGLRDRPADLHDLLCSARCFDGLPCAGNRHDHADDTQPYVDPSRLHIPTREHRDAELSDVPREEGDI